MKRVVYLHGLRSAQGGEKVDYLTMKHSVYAPRMLYDDVDLFEKELQKIKLYNPDVIIGSSMGGYFAERMASYFLNTKVLLFNPATIKEMTYYDIMDISIPKGDYEVGGMVVLGRNDDVLDPIENYEYYKDNKNFEVFAEDNDHRTPIDIFAKYVDKFV